MGVVNGPTTSIVNNIASWDNASGTLLKDGGKKSQSIRTSIFDYITDAGLIDRIVARTSVVGDAVAITSAINSMLGTTSGPLNVYMPSGLYWINGPIIISNPRQGISGDGSSVSIINNASTTQSAIVFQPSVRDDPIQIGACFIRDVAITRSDVSSSAGYALEIWKNVNFVLDGVTFNQHYQGMLVGGSHSGRYSNFYGSGRSGGAVAGSDTAVLFTTPASNNDGSHFNVENNVFENFVLAGVQKVSSTIRISGSDGIKFQGGYVNQGPGVNNNLHLEPSNDQGISGLTFLNTYFDATPGNISVPSSAENHVVYAYFGPGCTIGGRAGTSMGPVVIRNGLASLVFDTCYFTGAPNGYPYVDIDAPGASVSIVNCEINLCQMGIMAANGSTLRAIGNRFMGVTQSGQAAFNLSGTWETVVLANNIFCNFSTGALGIKNTATITRYSATGNSGDGTGSTDSSIGLFLPNVKNPNILALDWYEEAGALPVLSIGGSTTGITYSTTPHMNYTRIGNVVIGSLVMTLTSKGSNTGVLEVGPLPFPTYGDNAPPIQVRMTPVAPGTMNSQPYGSLLGTTIRLATMNLTTGIERSLTNADITNTTAFNMMIVYRPEG